MCTFFNFPGHLSKHTPFLTPRPSAYSIYFTSPVHGCGENQPSYPAPPPRSLVTPISDPKLGFLINSNGRIDVWG